MHYMVQLFRDPYFPLGPGPERHVASSKWKKKQRQYGYNSLRWLLCGGLVAQAVRRSPPTAGVPSSRLGHSLWVSWWTNRGLGGFSRGFSRFPLPQISFHHLSTLISSISFHFIALVMVRQAWSAGTLATHGLIFGASSHLIPRPDLVLDTSWGYLFMYLE